VASGADIRFSEASRGEAGDEHAKREANDIEQLFLLPPPDGKNAGLQEPRRRPQSAV